jgi:hypothetical protein
MTGASSLAFPGSRTLAGWWRQLAPRQPQAVWVGHLFLHRVEALFRLSRPCRLDPFLRHVLRALELEAHNPTSEPLPPEKVLDQLDDRLRLGRPVLRQVLRGLASEGLARTAPGGGWEPTDLGRLALQRQEYPRPGQERRALYFVEQPGPSDRPARPPHFLNLKNQAGAPWQAAEGWAFDPGVLQATLLRPEGWKQRHGFPLDVQEVLGLGSGADARGAEAGGNNQDESADNRGPAAEWQRVMLDRPEHLLAVLVLAPAAAGHQLLGFAVRQEGWVLQSAEPVLALGEGWQEVFPDLAEPPPEVWRQAWRAWCQPRSLPAEEAESCLLERQGVRLRVMAPRRFVERLRAARSDALKGEAWLLAGEGPVRAAALVEVAEVEPVAAPKT